MASPAAQTFFNQQPPATQAAIRASWGGADLMDQWFQNAVDAGDPSAVQAAGGQAIEGGGGVGVVEGQGAPTASWYGKRKPTPSELIRYYRETGKSEDFKRYSAAQVADWINRKWDVTGGYFTNDFGDVVEKPTESGAKSKAAGFATGEQDAGKAYTGGDTSAAPAAATPTSTPNDPLQARLLEMLQGGEGAFAGGAGTGSDLEGGGVWWGGANAGAANTPAVNPALTQATLTAFSPNAPSQQAGTQAAAAPAPTPVSSAVTGGVTRPMTTTVPGRIPTPPQPAPVSGGTDVLSAAVQRRYSDPNQWWTGRSR